MLVLFRTSPGFGARPHTPTYDDAFTNVWRFPVLANSRPNITMSPAIDLILSAGPVLAGGGAGKVGLLGEVRNALTVGARWKNDANWSLTFMVTTMTRSNDDSSFAVSKLIPWTYMPKWRLDSDLICLPPCCPFAKLCYDDLSVAVLPGTPDSSSFQKVNVHAKASFHIFRTDSS